MGTLKYTGPYDAAEFVKGDFTRVGVEDGHAVKWKRGEVKEVSDGMLNWLLENEPGSFEEADEDEAEEPDADVVDDKSTEVEDAGEGAEVQTGLTKATTTGATSTSGTRGTTGGKGKTRASRSV